MNILFTFSLTLLTYVSRKWMNANSVRAQKTKAKQMMMYTSMAVA